MTERGIGHPACCWCFFILLLSCPARSGIQCLWLWLFPASRSCRQTALDSRVRGNDRKRDQASSLLLVFLYSPAVMPGSIGHPVSLAFGFSRRLVRADKRPWIPAFAGMTERGIRHPVSFAFSLSYWERGGGIENSELKLIGRAKTERKDGAGERNRTSNQRFTKPLLCH